MPKAAMSGAAPDVDVQRGPLAHCRQARPARWPQVPRTREEVSGRARGPRHTAPRRAGRLGPGRGGQRRGRRRGR
eukprot:11217466-Lingulodinium_polyedra.AAC.1